VSRPAAGSSVHATTPGRPRLTQEKRQPRSISPLAFASPPPEKNLSKAETRKAEKAEKRALEAEKLKRLKRLKKLKRLKEDAEFKAFVKQINALEWQTKYVLGKEEKQRMYAREKVKHYLPEFTTKMTLLGAAFVIGGWSLIPAARIPLRILGAILGFGLYDKLVITGYKEMLQLAAEPSIAALLAEGFDKVTPEALDEIRKLTRRSPKEFEEDLCHVYLVFLRESLKTPGSENKKLPQLRKLKEVLGLSSANVARQFAVAAKVFRTWQNPQANAAIGRLVSREELILERLLDMDEDRLEDFVEDLVNGTGDLDLDSEDLEVNPVVVVNVAPLVFLAESMISDDEWRFYEYERTKLRKILDLTEEEWNAHVARVAEPFYDAALDSALDEGPASVGKDLSLIGEDLNISPERSAELRSRCFRRRVEAIVNETGVFTAADTERLDTLQAILNMSDAERTQQYFSAVQPFYQQVMEDVYDGVRSGISDIAAQLQKLDLRQKELLLDTSSAARSMEQEFLPTLFKVDLHEIMDLANLTGVFKAQRLERRKQALEKLRFFSSMSERLADFLTENQRMSNRDELVAYLSLENEEEIDLKRISQLYTWVVEDYLEGGKTDHAAKAGLDKLCHIFGLAESSSVYQRCAGEVYQKAVKAIMQRNVISAQQKTDIQTLPAKLGLASDVVKKICIEEYSNFVKLQRTYTEENREYSRLAEVRGVLGLDMSEVESVHHENFGTDYRDMLSRAMGLVANGGRVGDPIVMTEEDFNRCGEAQLRMGIPDEGALLDWQSVGAAALNNFAQRSAMVMKDTANAVQNGSVRENSDKEKKLKANVARMLDRMVQYADDSRFLIDGELSPGFAPVWNVDAKNLYEVYLVDAFLDLDVADEDKVGEKLELFKKVSACLGVKGEEKIATHRSAVFRILQSRYGRTLIAEDGFDPNAKAFLRNVVDLLDLNDDDADDVALKLANGKVEALIGKDMILPEDVRMIVDLANQVGVNITDRAPLARREQLFRIELVDLIVSEEITPGDYAALKELSDALGIPEDRATEVFLDEIANYIDDEVLCAYGSFLAGDEDGAVKEVDTVLKFSMVASPVGVAKVTKTSIADSVIDYFEVTEAYSIDEKRRNAVDVFKDFLQSRKEDMVLEEARTKLQSGCFAEVVGYTSFKDMGLNGKIVKLVHLNAKSGRWEVELKDSRDRGSKNIMIEATHLERIQDLERIQAIEGIDAAASTKALDDEEEEQEVAEEKDDVADEEVKEEEEEEGEEKEKVS